METFGQRLRGLRKVAGLHQEEVAARLGLPTTAISRMEKGTRDVTFAEAQALAQVFQMDLGTLAGEPDEGLGRTLRRLVLACSVEGRQDTIELLRGLADALEASLPSGPGCHAEAPEGDGLPQQTALRPAAHETEPAHPRVLRSNACARAGMQGVAPVGRRAMRWPPLLPLSLGLALGVFLLDLCLPLGVVVGIPYVAVVALASWTLRWRSVVGVALGCTGLTFLGFVCSPPGAPVWMDVTDRGLAMGALWAMVSLIYGWTRREAAFRQPQAKGYTAM